MYPQFQGEYTFILLPSYSLRHNSIEADIDAYLRNREYYPVGTFDETSDGNGNKNSIARHILFG